MAPPDDAPRLAPEILDHYREFDEASRLDAGSGPLERARTREIVQRRLPRGALDVLDVGGGTGVHAAWLAREGHRVELVDPVAEHVERARDLGARSDAGFKARLGDARKLPFGDERFDVALLFGPLYHLPEPADRFAALREAHRVLRPGGSAFVAAISRFASLFTGIRKAERWNDDAWRRCYLTRLRDSETERCVVEASAHVLAIGTKTG